MSDMTATMERVAGIVGTLQSMSATRPPTAATTSSRTAAPSASSSDFAAALDGATSAGGTTETTQSTVGATTTSLSSALMGVVGGQAGATAASSAAAGPSGGAASAAATASSAAAPAVDGDAVVADARRYLGIAYRWGGSDPSTGLDCSGLTQRVLADLGVKIPRTVAQQQHSGTAVASMAQARPGDLLVFGTHHIGIYIGGGKMLHAPHTGDVVKIAKVYETPTKIRRVVGAGDGVAGTAAGTAASYARPTALRGNGSTSYDKLFDAATRRYDLPAGLLKAVARAESNFNPRAHSPAGAIGLMQMMPGTARELGVDPHDPSEAVDGAARLLRSHLDQFGSVRLAVAAYNAGAGAVRRYDGVPPYAETRTYVKRVLAGMDGVAA
jgi:peptidoglycan DL-endopeptidase CwlO